MKVRTETPPFATPANLRAADLETLEEPFTACSKRLERIRIVKDWLRTPIRAARALEFLTNGYRQNLDDIVNDAIFDSAASEIILVKDIELYSMCEHHLLPFIGRAHVAYIPEWQSHWPVQNSAHCRCFRPPASNSGEPDYANCGSLMKCLEPSGVAVVVEAKHLCMMMRGVEKQNSVMKTSCLLGTFKEDARTRSEFLSLLA